MSKKGNPHRDELIQKLIEQSKTKTTKTDVNNALNEVKEQLDNVVKEEEPSDDGASKEGSTNL